jgi:hypothetical protein
VSTITAGVNESQRAERWYGLDPRHLRQPIVLVFNPNAGYKLGVDTNSSGADEVQEALRSEGLPFEAWPTEHVGHATDLARQAVAEGRELVIAAVKYFVPNLILNGQDAGNDININTHISIETQD